MLITRSFPHVFPFPDSISWAGAQTIPQILRYSLRYRLRYRLRYGLRYKLSPDPPRFIIVIYKLNQTKSNQTSLAARTRETAAAVENLRTAYCFIYFFHRKYQPSVFVLTFRRNSAIMVSITADRITRRKRKDTQA